MNGSHTTTERTADQNSTCCETLQFLAAFALMAVCIWGASFVLRWLFDIPWAQWKGIIAVMFLIAVSMPLLSENLDNAKWNARFSIVPGLVALGLEAFRCMVIHWGWLPAIFVGGIVLFIVWGVIEDTRLKQNMGKD